MRQIGVGTPGGAEASALFDQLLYDERMTGSLMFWDDRMAGGARGGVAVSPQAHGSTSVETSKLVSCRAIEPIICFVNDVDAARLSGGSTKSPQLPLEA